MVVAESKRSCQVELNDTVHHWNWSTLENCIGTVSIQQRQHQQLELSARHTCTQTHSRTDNASANCSHKLDAPMHMVAVHATAGPHAHLLQ